MSDGPELMFRPATEDDLPLMAEIIREAFVPVAERLGINQESVPYFPAYETPQGLRQHLDEWDIRMIMLLVDGEVVGCGGWSPDAEGEPRGWLARIAVRPACQGRGYGTALVRRLEEELRRHGYRRVRLAHADLHHFYERLGYETVETKYSEKWRNHMTFQDKDL